MPGGNKKSHVLKQTCKLELQICLSTSELLLPLAIKGSTAYYSTFNLP